jgi:copper chaperone
MEKSYTVDGMTCGGCARSVTAAIQAKAPGLTVEVDLEARRVRVAGPHESKQVEDAVEGAGFDFLGVAD